MKKTKLLLTTLCCLVGLGCFCNAELLGELKNNSTTIMAGRQQKYSTTEIRCFYTNYGGMYYRFSSGDTVNQVQMNSDGTIYCFNSDIYIYNSNNATRGIYHFTGVKDLVVCPSCPDQYSSLECQSEYNLIPISSVDENYCVNNNLCPVGGGDCESGSVNWSSLYINNIQHLGKPNIFITIPEEIDWDYTNETGSFDLDIVGYNVDYEKMGEILEVQNYKPSSEDFTNLVGLLAPYMSILVFCLFAYIVIRRLKKPFSSKLK